MYDHLFAGRYPAARPARERLHTLDEAAKLAGCRSAAEFKAAIDSVSDSLSGVCLYVGADGARLVPETAIAAVKRRRAAPEAFAPPPATTSTPPASPMATPPTPRKEPPTMSAVASIDQIVKANPRDAGFAAALALQDAIHATPSASAMATAQRPAPDNRIYDRTRERPPAIPMSSVRRDAQAKFDALLREKFVKRANDKRALGRDPRLVATEIIQLREEVFAENEGLRESMIREANEGRGRFGLRPQGR